MTEEFAACYENLPPDRAAKLEGTNFQWVREIIAGAFEIAKEEGLRQGGRYAIKTELADGLRPFMANPCLETAVTLLNAEPSLWWVFEHSKRPFARSPLGDVSLAWP